jgi:hypothetical protein
MITPREGAQRLSVVSGDDYSSGSYPEAVPPSSFGIEAATLEARIKERAFSLFNNCSVSLVLFG